MFNIQQQAQMPAGVSVVDFVVSVQGSVITINGAAYDFGFMEKGSSLPHDAVDSVHVYPQDITCDDAGVITIRLYVPVLDPSQPLPTLKGKRDGKLIDIHLPAVDLPRMPDAPNAAEETANG